MKIIYLHQYFNTPQMSGGTRSYEMARRLVSWGHEVHVVTSWRDRSSWNGQRLEVIDGINVHWIPVGYSNRMGFFSRIAAFFKFALLSAARASSLPADVVFATSTPLTIAIPGVLASWRLKAPLVFEVRDLWPEVPIALGVLKNSLMVKLAKWLERFAYRNSARVVALAPGMADGVVAAGTPSNAVSIIPNGCDSLFFTEGHENPVEKKLTVLYIGTIGPANGVHYIPRLADAVRRIFPSIAVRFVIVGDGKCLPEVKELTEELQLSDEMVHFAGAVPKNVIPGYLAECTATIMTYDGPEVLYRDSVSNKFFDSIAAGKLVFANFEGFSTLIAKEAGAGEILPRDDLDEAARKLMGILMDKELILRARMEAAKLAHNTFSRERLAKMLEAVLMQSIQDRRQSAGVPVGCEFRELWDKVRHE